jgi:phosphatidylinositol-3-phosphatase
LRLGGSLTKVAALAAAFAVSLPVSAVRSSPSVGLAGSTHVRSRADGGVKAVHAIHTVFLIVMENHDWSSIAGSSSAPYINGTLLKIGAHAEHYYNPPGTHPSLPNYLWLEAGDSLGVGADGPPSDYRQSTTHHLTALLARAGISWRAYEEGISGKSCPLTDAYPYATRHNPMIYFDDVTGGGNQSSAYCIAHERPYTQLAADLRKNAVARYNFITPDLCDDMHDDCGPFNDSVRQGDSWLAHALPPILGSRAYRNGGAVFITWDEGEGDDGPIGMIVLSPLARKGYAGNAHYTHSSTLRTVQEIFDVRPFLRDAAHATDLRALFTRFP